MKQLTVLLVLLACAGYYHPDACAQNQGALISFGAVKENKIVSKSNFQFQYVWDTELWATTREFGELKFIKVFAMLLPTEFTTKLRAAGQQEYIGAPDTYRCCALSGQPVLSVADILE